LIITTPESSSLSFRNKFKIPLIMLMTTAPKKVAQKLSDVKPKLNIDDSQIVSDNISVLMISMNSPNVSTTNGQLKNKIIGRMMAFTSPKIAAITNSSNPVPS